MDEAAVFGAHAAKTDRDLCKSCRWCIRARGHRDSTEFRHCTAVPAFARQPPQPVTVCNAYRSSNHPTYDELWEAAWLITSDRRTGRIGFSTPEERRRAGAPTPDGRR